jgi:hypothetical protein
MCIVSSELIDGRSNSDTTRDGFGHRRHDNQEGQFAVIPDEAVETCMCIAGFLALHDLAL